MCFNLTSDLELTANLFSAFLLGQIMRLDTISGRLDEQVRLATIATVTIATVTIATEIIMTTIYIRKWLKIFPTQLLSTQFLWGFLGSLTLMLMLANFPNSKWWKKPGKWLKPWQMGTHPRVLSESYPMNTNMTGFQWFSEVSASLCFGRK